MIPMFVYSYILLKHKEHPMVQFPVGHIVNTVWCMDCTVESTDQIVLVEVCFLDVPRRTRTRGTY